MYQEFTLAGEGMRKLFLAQIIVIISTVVMVIPIIGLIGVLGALAGFVLMLVGLHQAGPAHPYFKTAMTITVVNIVASLLQSFTGDDSWLGSLLGIVISVLSLLVTYYVCHAAAELLTEKGDGEEADKGIRVWKLYLGCTVVGVVCTVVAIIPVLGVLAVAVLIVAGIVELVAGILYLLFLCRASASLLG